MGMVMRDKGVEKDRDCDKDCDRDCREEFRKRMDEILRRQGELDVLLPAGSRRYREGFKYA